VKERGQGMEGERRRERRRKRWHKEEEGRGEGQREIEGEKERREGRSRGREGGRGQGSNNWQHHTKQLWCKDTARVTMQEAVQLYPGDMNPGQEPPPSEA